MYNDPRNTDYDCGERIIPANKGKTMGIEKTLKRAEVFLGLDDNDLSKIASLPSCREESYQADEVIFRRGSEAKYLYVLKEGQVNLVMEVFQKDAQAATKVVVDRITTGGIFGWSALVKPHVYSLTAICKEASGVVVISGVELIALFEEDYHIGYKVFQSLSRIIGTRLRETQQVLIMGRRWPFLEEGKSL